MAERRQMTQSRKVAKKFLEDRDNRTATTRAENRVRGVVAAILPHPLGGVPRGMTRSDAIRQGMTARDLENAIRDAYEAEQRRSTPSGRTIAEINADTQRAIEHGREAAERLRRSPTGKSGSGSNRQKVTSSTATPTTRPTPRPAARPAEKPKKGPHPWPGGSKSGIKKKPNTSGGKQSN